MHLSLMFRFQRNNSGENGYNCFIIPVTGISKTMARGKGKVRAGRKGRKVRRARRNANVKDVATLSVKHTLTSGSPGGGFLPNTLYSAMGTQLADFTRAVQVANAYQHYKIKKIRLTFKPTYDTYAPTGGTTIGKPNLYYMIDKSGSIPANITLENLKQMGARPRQLDEKNMSVSWTPTVLEVSMTAGGAAPTSTPSKYVVSPWLATNENITAPGVFVASRVDHLGIYWYVDQANPGTTPPTYNCEIEVQFAFKKPLSVLSSSAVPAIPALLAIANDSADGIVGGNDGV